MIMRMGIMIMITQTMPDTITITRMITAMLKRRRFVWMCTWG